MRTENSIKNSISAFSSNVIAIIVVFLSQTVFIKVLGSQYLGINNLFSNILTMFSFLELGIGSVITYKLYKPVSLNDKENIKTLMLFYKRVYYIIALITFILSLLVMPFIKSIIGQINIDINIYLVYLLFTLNLSISYLFSYKRCLIYVNQKSYLINIVHIFYLILMNLLQIILLIKTKNFYIYLLVKITFQLLENIVITVICNKKYPYIKEKNINALEKEEKQEIYNKVKAGMYHKGAYAIVCGTDNILISYFFGITIVGIYSNYYMIITSLTLVCASIIEAVSASVGNMLALKENKKFDIFKKIKFLNFIISTVSSIILLNAVEPFIKLWLGSEYILPYFVLIVLVINYFITMERKTYLIFKEASGIWEDDKYVPLVETILNIVFSLICIKMFGLAGVFIGTVLSSLVLYFYDYPKYVYKKILNRTYKEYIKESLKSVLLFLIILIITTFINSFTTNLILNILISAFVPVTILFVIFKEKFIYYINLLKRRL